MYHGQKKTSVDLRPQDGISQKSHGFPKWKWRRASAEKRILITTFQNSCKKKIPPRRTHQFLYCFLNNRRGGSAEIGMSIFDSIIKNIESLTLIDSN